MSPDLGLLVEEIASAAGLEALRPEWLDLWQRVPDATPFQSPAWLIPWWRVFGRGELITLALRREGRLVGVVPLYIYPEGEARKVLPVGIGISDYLDPLIEPDHAAAGAGAALAWLAGQRERFDWCDLECQREGSPWRTVALPPGWRVLRHAGDPCPFLALPEQGAKPHRYLSKHRRERLRYYWRRCEQVGPARVQTTTPETLDAMLAALIRLHAARWQARGEPGVLADPKVQAFHRLAAPALLEAGLLRLYALDLTGHTAAVFYALADRRCFRLYLCGIDPSLAHLSLGKLMVAHVLHEAVREGMSGLDFLRGREPYKLDWGAAERWTWGMRLLPGALRRCRRRCDTA